MERNNIMLKGFYGDSIAPMYSGVCTFLELPFKADLKEVDYAVFGMPFEAGSINRVETRYAPSAIRNHISFRNPLSFSDILNVDASETLQGTDLGEVPILFGYKTPSLRAIEEQVKEIVDNDVVSIGMGGGQLVTLAELRAMKEKYGKMAFVHFDSERDCRDCEEKFDDSTVVIRAIEEGLIDPSCSIQLGMRGGYESKEECNFAKDMGMTVLTAAMLHKMTEKEAVEKIKDVVGDTPCFISYDMSFLDPVFAPGVTTPAPGGFSTYFVNKVFRSLGLELNLKGFDIVDLTPAFDPGYITSQAASANMKAIIIGMSKRKQLKGEL